MKRLVRIFKIPEFYCALLLVICIAGGLVMRVNVENATLERSGLSEPVAFPVAQPMAHGELFKVDLDLVGTFDVPYDLQVVPDDCAQKMKINGERLNLDGVEGLCDFTKGFVVKGETLSPYKKGGSNHYTFYMRNNGGNAGLNIFVHQTSPLVFAANVGAILFLSLLCFLIALRLKLRWKIALLIFLGVVLRVVFFENVSYTTYTHDVGGHIDYIEYILEKHAVPGDKDCWSCYHPPVYYLTSAVAYKLGNIVGVPGTTGLQSFSLLLSVATLLFGILFLRSFLSGRLLGISSLLWTFWPVLILMSPRVGNDQMFCMLHVLCLWSGATYLKSGRGKYLIVAVLATALAMWTKTTAAVTLGMLMLFAVCGYFMNARFLHPTKSEVVAWVLLVALLVAVVLQKVLGETGLVDNTNGLNPRLRVGNEAFNYIYFDLENFIRQPFTSAWDDEYGRQYFWNYTFKTALFGEFRMSSLNAARVLATTVSCTFLGLLAYGLRGFWQTKLKLIHWLLLLQAFAFLSALMFLRIKYPYSCSNDFRFIVPIILSFGPFVALGIHAEGASTKWKVLGWAVLSGFVLSTVILYILVM